MNSINRVLIDTMVRKAIKDIQDSPKRSTRNLVDMALNFSEGRFQKHFFQTAQRMLKNEQSGYYGLIQDVVTHVDTERLMSFGMNLGYNSCTAGAGIIRGIEAEQGFNIPWSLSLQIDGQTCAGQEAAYQALIRQGKELGIYTWMLFADSDSQNLLPLVESYPDCAFVLFIPPEEVTAGLLDEIGPLHNLAVAVRLTDGAAEVCNLLRQGAFLYAVYLPYSEKDVQGIVSGEVLCEAEALHPAFTIFVPEPDTPTAARQVVYDYVNRMRMEQAHQTVAWELLQDGLFIDSVISEDACSAGFDAKGRFHPLSGSASNGTYGLFAHTLQEIFSNVFPKTHSVLEFVQQM